MNLRVPVCHIIGVPAERLQAALDAQARPVRHLVLAIALIIEGAWIMRPLMTLQVSGRLPAALTSDLRHGLDRVVRLDALLILRLRIILRLQLLDRRDACLARNTLRLPTLIEVEEGISVHVASMVIVADVPLLLLAHLLSDQRSGAGARQ